MNADRTNDRAFATGATVWRLRTRSLSLGRMPLLMGIVNVTPDSFSDGGRFFKLEDAVEHALQLAAEGADILDIGGESTRPGSQPVGVDEELRRVIPVIQAVRRACDCPISIDTTKAAVARAALDEGAEIVNDTIAATDDPEMAPLAAKTECGLCIMHRQGRPATMQQSPQYDDVVAEVFEYLKGRRDALMAAGVERDRIAVDPGIGFGKTTEHNRQLLAAAEHFREIECPVLYGPSRKAFIGRVLGDPAADRTAGTIGAALALALQGVQILRIHDVRPVRDALELFYFALLKTEN